MHNFIPIPGQAAPTPVDPDHLAAVKRWSREILNLPDTSVVTLHEIACIDPGCPLVECTLAVFDASGPTRSWRFTRPRAALTKLMVQQTLAMPPKTNPHRVDAPDKLSP